MMANYDWANLTPLGRQLAISAGGDPNDGYMTSAGAGYAPGYFDNNYGALTSGGQYTFAKNNLTNWSPQRLQNSASVKNGQDYTDTGWARFMDANGKPMAAFKDGDGIRVFPDPGDFGGTGFSGQKLGKMAGVKYDKYDASGNYIGNGTFDAKDGWKDEGIGDALGVLSVIAMAYGGGALADMAAGAGAGAGAAGAAAGGAGAGLAAGGAGAADAAMAAAAADAAGTGLAAGSAGTGLSLGGGGLGLSGSTGAGLSLAGGGGIGLTGASAGSGAIGAGLGGGLAGGTGSLLGPAALAGAGGAAGAALGAGAGSTVSGAAGSIFNPAVDSQLASTQLGITGSQAAADAAAAAIPSVTVNGAPTGSWLSNLTASGGAVPGTGDVGGGPLDSLGSGASSLIPGVSNSTLGQIGTSLLGGALGSQANTANTTKQLPSYLQGPVANDLVPRTQGLLASQMPQAQASGQQMIAQGGGLLGAQVAGNGYGTVGANVAGNGYGSVGGPVAGNGYGQVQMADPGSFMNPYYEGMANDMSRRTADLLGQNNLAISGHSVGTGGLGGSRMGVEQGLAAGKAADSLQGNLAGLGGNMYQSALSGALNKYGTDVGFYGQQRGQDLQGSAQNQNFYTAQRNTDVSKAGMDQSFYGNQRGQDLAQVGIGSGLVNQGYQTQWQPLTQAAGTYSPFTGFGTTTASQGGGVQGALGGALGAAQLGSNLGWW